MKRIELPVQRHEVSIAADSPNRLEANFLTIGSDQEGIMTLNLSHFFAQISQDDDIVVSQIGFYWLGSHRKCEPY